MENGKVNEIKRECGKNEGKVVLPRREENLLLHQFSPIFPSFSHLFFLYSIIKTIVYLNRRRKIAAWMTASWRALEKWSWLFTFHIFSLRRLILSFTFVGRLSHSLSSLIHTDFISPLFFFHSLPLFHTHSHSLSVEHIIYLHYVYSNSFNLTPLMC